MGEELRDELLHNINSTIPDFWTIMVDQYGDVAFGSVVNLARNISIKTIIPMNTSITLFHPRIAVHVEKCFLHP
jgi:hypothetical protein